MRFCIRVEVKFSISDLDDKVEDISKNEKENKEHFKKCYKIYETIKRAFIIGILVQDGIDNEKNFWFEK